MVSGRCPVKETLERLGLLQLLRPMCSTDYPNMAMKNSLWCAHSWWPKGPVCGMRIAGPASELAKSYPPYTTAEGYVVNDIPV